MVRLTENAPRKYPLTDPDVQLMLRVRDGDIDAFNQLWQQYRERVRFVLEHLLGNRRNSDDLAQEVFLRVYRARANYVPTAKFSTWLFTIVNNVVSNARRSISVRREVQVSNAGKFRSSPLDRLNRDTGLDEPPASAERGELCSVIRIAVGRLNDRQKTAVELYNFEGKSHAQIATEMQTTPDAVKSLLHRARVNLHSMLTPSLDEGLVPQSV